MRTHRALLIQLSYNTGDVVKFSLLLLYTHACRCGILVMVNLMTDDSNMKSIPASTFMMIVKVCVICSIV